jgi:hypothetical protein
MAKTSGHNREANWARSRGVSARKAKSQFFGERCSAPASSLALFMQFWCWPALSAPPTPQNRAGSRRWNH